MVELLGLSDSHETFPSLVNVRIQTKLWKQNGDLIYFLASRTFLSISSNA